jgi:hypothetical protein
MLAVLAAIIVPSVITTASAALPEFIPAKGKFSGTGAAGTLETKTKGTIECGHSEFTGEIKSASQGILTIDYHECKIFDILGAHSLGDKEGVFLYGGTVLANLCYVNKAEKHVGLVIHIPSQGTHAEVAGKLFLLSGSIIGAITPINSKTKKFTVTFKQENAKQEISKCEGGAEEILLVSENEGAAEQSADELTSEGIFTEEHEIIA